MRDSKLGDESPVLQFTYTEWDAFLASVVAGELGRRRTGSRTTAP